LGTNFPQFTGWFTQLPRRQWWVLMLKRNGETVIRQALSANSDERQTSGKKSQSLIVHSILQHL
jgi:hypothetical protein